MKENFFQNEGKVIEFLLIFKLSHLLKIFIDLNEKNEYTHN